MGTDDEEARNARAKALRAEIARLTEQPDEPPAQQVEQTIPLAPESPRDFIHRRMKEEVKKEEA